MVSYQVKNFGSTDPVRTISGQQFVQITHSDHHMYSSNNNVTISGVSSGITTTLNGAINNWNWCK